MTEIPFGDPGAMRAFAFDVSLAAERVGTVAHDFDTGAYSFEWDGLAAVRFRSNITELSSGAKTIADRLKALSEYLVQQAGILEQQQADARRQIAAEEAMNKAKLEHMKP